MRDEVDRIAHSSTFAMAKFDKFEWSYNNIFNNSLSGILKATDRLKSNKLLIEGLFATRMKILCQDNDNPNHSRIQLKPDFKFFQANQDKLNHDLDIAMYSYSVQGQASRMDKAQDICYKVYRQFCRVDASVMLMELS